MTPDMASKITSAAQAAAGGASSALQAALHSLSEGQRLLVASSLALQQPISGAWPHVKKPHLWFACMHMYSCAVLSDTPHPCDADMQQDGHTKHVEKVVSKS